MRAFTVQARAKLNLTLDVLEKRTDGYHDLLMVLQPVALCDEIDIELLDEPRFFLSCSLPYLPGDQRNLALAAAKLYLSRCGRGPAGASLTLRKRIPVSAGLGGGSADAAAVLRGLNDALGGAVSERDLMAWALELGSDVPFCLYGKTALAEGRGEILTPLTPLTRCPVVLCKPHFNVSTKEAFGSIDPARLKGRPDTRGMIAALDAGDAGRVARCMYNVFEPPLAERHRELGRIRRIMIDGGALGACMSGTGSTFFGLFASRETALGVCARLKPLFPDTFLTETV